MRYYDIARLRHGKGIEVRESELIIDLDAVTGSDHVTSDAELRAAAAPGVYFFPSGGGTLLLNGRDLLIVRRHRDSGVNPGYWSLFTGRAEGPREWAEPWRVARELFEELVLVSPDGRPLRFLNEGLQPVIDQAQRSSGGSLNCAGLMLRSMQHTNGTLTVCRDRRVVCEMPAFWHIGPSNDINLLFLFEAAIDLNEVAAMDGEERGPRRRDIAALDLDTMMIRPLGASESRSPVSTAGSPLTPHLTALVDSLVASRQSRVLGGGHAR